MSTIKCTTVIAGEIEDENFGHLCFIAEALETLLPNFYFKSIAKTTSDWKPWLSKICARYDWSHTESPLVWREIGITATNTHYVGGSSQFWSLLRKYYNITSYLTKEDLEALQMDLLFAHKIKEKVGCLEVTGERRRVTLIGAGRSICPDLVPELLLVKELWLSHGVIVSLYDEPGYLFKVKKVIKDVEGIGAGLNAVKVLKSVADGLCDCDILIYIDSLVREEYEGTRSWLGRNYKLMEDLARDINHCAPSHMKVIFCSMGPICFCANTLQVLVKNISKNNIVAASAHYGLELISAIVGPLGYSMKNFGCPPVWGFLGISHFVDVCHMIEKYDGYRSNERAITSSNNTLPLDAKDSELRWFFYKAHDKNPYEFYYKRKGTTQYQVGRMEYFQKCKAICDLLKLWCREEAGDEIISLGIPSDGTFGLPRGLVFSQPAHLMVLKDKSRVWVPFADFPKPNMPTIIFQNIINTASFIRHKYIYSRNSC